MSGERTAIDGTRWRTQVAGQVGGHDFNPGKAVVEAIVRKGIKRNDRRRVKTE